MSIKSPYAETRQMRFTSYELSKLKVFKDNDLLLKLIRPVFWQVALDEDQVNIIKDSLNKDTIDVLEKLFDPKLNWEEPIFEMGSRWIDRRYAELLSAETKPTVLARQDDIKFQKAGIKRLRNIIEGNFEPLEMHVDLNMEKDYENLPAEEVKRYTVAMQDALTFLESRLVEIRTLSGMSEESPEEREERLKKDSSK